MTERRIAGIYGVLPADLDEQLLMEKAEAAMKGGIRLLQLRDKKTGYRKRLKRAQALRALCRTYSATLVVNDSMQLATESGADGVHLGRSDLGSLTQLRSEVGESLLIGVSCKADAAFARQMLDAGADYLSFGAVFPTGSKADATPIGLPRLAKARQTFPDANICAIGGITLESLPAIREAGADCAAVISALFDVADTEAQARSMIAAWRK